MLGNTSVLVNWHANAKPQIKSCLHALLFNNACLSKLFFNQNFEFLETNTKPRILRGKLISRRGGLMPLWIQLKISFAVKSPCQIRASNCEYARGMIETMDRFCCDRLCCLWLDCQSMPPPAWCSFSLQIYLERWSAISSVRVEALTDWGCCVWFPLASVLWAVSTFFQEPYQRHERMSCCP